MSHWVFIPQIHEKVLGELHPSVMGTLESLARACGLSGHDDHGIKYYDEYLERLYEMQDENREEQARIMYDMSKLYGKLGDRSSQAEKLQVAAKLLRIDGEISAEGAELEYMILEELKHVRRQIALRRGQS